MKADVVFGVPVPCLEDMVEHGLVAELVDYLDHRLAFCAALVSSHRPVAKVILNVDNDQCCFAIILKQVCSFLRVVYLEVSRILLISYFTLGNIPWG